MEAGEEALAEWAGPDLGNGAALSPLVGSVPHLLQAWGPLESRVHWTKAAPASSLLEGSPGGCLSGDVPQSS